MCSQRMNQGWVARTPCDDFDQLTSGDGTVFLRLLTNGPFGCRNFMLRISMKFSHKIIIIIPLVEVQFLQGQMSSGIENEYLICGGLDQMEHLDSIPAGQQHPLARPIDGHRRRLQVTMCSRPCRLPRHTWRLSIIKCFRK